MWMCQRLRQTPQTDSILVGYLARIGETLFKLLKAVAPLRPTLHENVTGTLKEREGELLQSSITLVSDFCGCINAG